MSIFSRLLGIVKAQVGSQTAGKDDEFFYDEYMRKRKSRRHKKTPEPETPFQEEDNNQQAAPNPDWNPELAQLYANLEVPYGSDLETVRASWKRLLRKYHPDVQSGDKERQDLSNKLVQQINAAYKELEKRLKD